MKYEVVTIGELSYFIETNNEDEIKDCSIYKTDEISTIEEISKNIGLSKTAISNIVRRAIKKIYKEISKEYCYLNPVEKLSIIIYILKLNTDKQYKCLYNTLPDNIKEEIIKYAYEKYRKRY